jgi:hypothetical protein
MRRDIEPEERRAMTVAVDVKTGKVIGQVVWTYTKGVAASNPSVHVLTKNGYEVLPAASVRLEKV